MTFLQLLYMTSESSHQELEGSGTFLQLLYLTSQPSHQELEALCAQISNVDVEAGLPAETGTARHVAEMAVRLDQPGRSAHQARLAV
mmetsp:Transcript_35851/g.59412  ORF Transcript_35851/g.59412 Transcript_35851/m.59412 type:complete len:87 (-) Transcript_35851:159-419(-)